MAKSCYARQGYGRTGRTPSSIDARPRNADPPDRRISRPPRRRPCRRRRPRNADPPDRRISRRLKVPCPGIVTGHRLNPTSGRGASRSGALGARVASGSASHVVVRALARRQRPGRRPRGPPPAYGPPSRPEQPVKHPLHIDGRGPDPPAGPFFGELVHELPYAVRYRGSCAMPSCSPLIIAAISARSSWQAQVSVRTPIFVREALLLGKSGENGSSYSFPFAIDAWIVSDSAGRLDLMHWTRPRQSSLGRERAILRG